MAIEIKWSQNREGTRRVVVREGIGPIDEEPLKCPKIANQMPSPRRNRWVVCYPKLQTPKVEQLDIERVAPMAIHVKGAKRRHPNRIVCG